MNLKYKQVKLHQIYSLCQDVILHYPEAIDELLEFLITAKEAYNQYQTIKSIQQEYVVFEERIETTNG